MLQELKTAARWKMWSPETSKSRFSCLSRFGRAHICLDCSALDLLQRQIYYTHGSAFVCPGTPAGLGAVADSSPGAGAPSADPPEKHLWWKSPRRSETEAQGASMPHKNLPVCTATLVQCEHKCLQPLDGALMIEIRLIRVIWPRLVAVQGTSS